MCYLFSKRFTVAHAKKSNDDVGKIKMVYRTQPTKKNLFEILIKAENLSKPINHHPVLIELANFRNQRKMCKWFARKFHNFYRKNDFPLCNLISVMCGQWFCMSMTPHSMHQNQFNGCRSHAKKMLMTSKMNCALRIMTSKCI